LSDRLQAFFESQGMAIYGCQYTLEGKQLDDRHAQGLVAVNAMAGLAATNPRSKRPRMASSVITKDCFT
jgi:oligosaccharide reducing-end xylanase